ncbi:MAG: RNA-dependent RNA polymerase [Narnavirus sp.]|uniref:RNA-directed RNA polymerase n=1 Tax=H4BulkLitter234 virus TaxID=2847102 RepID=A0A514DAU9_9MONO|nr:MAG: RNA-dependent RNA polymerase [Narnavirus sp.]QDH90729.1 MAG: RNA-dependent RNA polymerase [H4BulkLitter234 virus]
MDHSINTIFGQLSNSTVVKPLTPEKHLQSPVINTIIHRMRNIIAKFITEYRPTIVSLPNGKALHTQLRQRFGHKPELMYSSLLPKLLPYCEIFVDNKFKHPIILTPKMYPDLLTTPDAMSANLQQHMSEADYVTSIEMKCYFDWIKDIIPKKDHKSVQDKLFRNTILSTDTLNWWKYSEYWGKVVEENRVRVKTDTRKRKYVTNHHIFIMTSSFIVMYDKNGTNPRILVMEQLQLLQDSARGRFNVHLAIDMNLSNGTANLRQLVIKQLKWQDDCLRKYDNDGYDLCKAPEALMKTYLTTLTSGDVMIPSSFERTVVKIKDKERDLDKETPLVNQYTDFIKKEVTDIGDACELFGLCKLAGHPLVYAEKSGEKIRKLANGSKTTMVQAVLENRRMFRHMIVEAYIRHYHTWPKFKDEPAPGTKLHRHWVQRSSSLPLQSIDLRDYDHIRFTKLHDFSYHLDYMEYLEDKAICPGASETPFFWFSETQMGRPKQEERRLLLKTLQTDIDCHSLVERFRRGGFTDEELVVELTQKEREFKNSARCFAKMTLEVRLYWLILESNLKSIGSILFPELTMTMSEAEEKNRLYDLVKVNKPNVVRTELDLGHWNISWYEDNCKWIAEDFEDIFDMPGAWSQVFYFFNQSTIIVMDKNYLPPGATPDKSIHEWPESNVLIRRWSGGQEGIQQYLWSIATVVMAKWELRDVNASFSMAGQGDNQVFTFAFDTSTTPLHLLLEETLNKMEIRCYMLNHELKPEECIDSKTVLTYSKEIYVNGAHRMYTLKFASRAFSRADREIPSLSKDVASIMATSMAVADTLKSPVEAVRWKNAQLRLYLLGRTLTPVHKNEHHLIKMILNSRARYLFFSTLPGSLGGAPIMGWTRFFMKGEVDDLSWDVASYLSVAKHYSTVASDLTHLIRGDYSPEKPRPEDLINDPNSIPLLRPSDRLSLIKTATESKVMSMVTNKDIDGILKSYDESKELQKDLSRTKPFYPDIMQDIYKLSVPGLRERFLARFNMTRTLSKFAPSIVDQIEQANIGLMNFIHKRFRLANTERLTCNYSSPFEVCQKLRDLWKCDINNQNIGVYTPFEFALGYRSEDEPWISVQVDNDPEHLFTKPGSYSPNFGTKTRAKVSSHGYKIYDETSTVKDLKSLVLTASELGSDSTLFKLLNNIAQTRSPWTLENLSTILPVSIGGCAAHRHQRSNQAHFSTLGSRTVPTHLNYCSDDAGVLSGGFDDYPIIFQSIYLTLANLVGSISELIQIPKSWVFGLMLTDSYVSIDDTPVSIESPPTYSRKVDLSGNSLAYVNMLESYMLPDLPSPNIIPHTTSPESSPKSLLYSYFLTTLPQKLKQIDASTKTTNLPIDLMDFKEFILTPFADILDASISYIISEVLFETQGYPEKMAGMFNQLCYKMGSLLTRMFTHPLSLKLKGREARQFTQTAGTLGGLGSAQKLADELLLRVISAVQYKNIFNDVKLILVNQDLEISRLSTEKYCLFLLAGQPCHSNIWIYISPAQCRRVRVTLQDPLIQTVNHLALSAKHLMIAGSEIKLRHHFRSPPNVKITYTNHSRETLIRQLRLLKAPEIPKIPIPPTNIELTDMIPISFTRTHSQNQLLPQPQPAERNKELIKVESYLQTSRRKIGEYSGITSDWLATIRATKFNKDKKLVYCLGVGEGGSAAACLLTNVPKVCGIDLRSSFPIVAGREATYKPAEVVSKGLDSRFYWDQIVWEKGGDCLQLEQFPQGNLIVDMDLHEDKIVDQIIKMKGEGDFLWRQRVSTDWLKAILSCIPDVKAYDLTILPKLSTRIVIFHGKRTNILRENIDFSSLSILSHPKSNYIVHQGNDSLKYTSNSLKLSEQWVTSLESTTIHEIIKKSKLFADADQVDLDDTRNRLANINTLEQAQSVRDTGIINYVTLTTLTTKAIRILAKLSPASESIIKKPGLLNLPKI